VEVRSGPDGDFSLSTFAIPGLTETGFAGCGPDQGKLGATTTQRAYWAAFASNERLGMKLQVNVSNHLSDNSLESSKRLLEPNLVVSVDIIGGNEDLHQELVQQQFETLDYLGAVEFGLGIVGEQTTEQPPEPGFRAPTGIIRSNPAQELCFTNPCDSETK
jgi:hypothetical protein